MEWSDEIIGSKPQLGFTKPLTSEDKDVTVGDPTDPAWPELVTKSVHFLWQLQQVTTN